jgi:Beta-glucanase/Beta-glucan synthetase
VYDCVRRGGYWVPECVFVEDGNLIIETKINDDGAYVTGAIDSAGKYENTFGYYETRCKVPAAYGIWAAFWLMCDKMGLENSDATVGGAEIDIFESPFYPSKMFQCAIHIGGYGDNKIDYSYPYLKGGDNFYTDWHTFGLDWQADGYKFYYDDLLFYETDCADNISTVDGFLFLSVEIGGTNGTAGDSPFFPNYSPTKNESSVWPERFEVDYVRVYEKKPN